MLPFHILCTSFVRTAREQAPSAESLPCCFGMCVFIGQCQTDFHHQLYRMLMLYQQKYIAALLTEEDDKLKSTNAF